MRARRNGVARLGLTRTRGSPDATRFMDRHLHGFLARAYSLEKQTDHGPGSDTPATDQEALEAIRLAETHVSSVEALIAGLVQDAERRVRGGESRREARVINHRRYVARIVASLAMALLSTIPATAQSLKFVVGLPAGGAIDGYARVVADPIGQALGKSAIVENRPSASGNLAGLYVSQAPADGSTIWVGTMANTEINPHVFENLRWSVKDFLPLVKGVEAPLVLVTHPSVPAKNLDELVAWIKARPGKLAYASYSAGTPSHFLGAQLTGKFGLDLAHVPFPGSGPQAINLVGGHALFGFAQVQSVLPQVQAGKLNAIAVTSEKRYRAFPDTPSFAELGLPDFTAGIWFGLLIRAATPPDVAKKLLDTSIAVHADGKIRNLLLAQGFDMGDQNGEPFLRSIEAGSERWARVIKSTGFRAAE